LRHAANLAPGLTSRPSSRPSQWFAIFLQLAVMIGFGIALATDSLPLYQLQLSIFGAVALVFAVGGVSPLSPTTAPWSVRHSL
jgi:hypothetical protein